MRKGDYNEYQVGGWIVSGVKVLAPLSLAHALENHLKWDHVLGQPHSPKSIVVAVVLLCGGAQSFSRPEEFTFRLGVSHMCKGGGPTSLPPRTWLQQF